MTHAVDPGIAPGRFDGIGVDVDGHNPRRAEPERAESEDAAPAAHIEDPLTAGDPPQETLDDLRRRGMAAVAEAARSELDQARKAPAIVLRPRPADAEPLVEGDRTGVLQPSLESGPFLWPRDRHHAFGSQRCHQSGHTPIVVHASQHHPAAVARRDDGDRARTE